MHGGQRESGAGHSMDLYSRKEDSAVGAVTGGVIDAILGAVAIEFIPGIGPICVVGCIAARVAAILVGAAAGGTAAGLFGALTSMNIAKEEAEYLEQEIKTDHAVVTVEADTRWSEAIDLLRRSGAYHIGTSGNIQAPRRQRNPCKKPMIVRPSAGVLLNADKVNADKVTFKMFSIREFKSYRGKEWLGAMLQQMASRYWLSSAVQSQEKETLIWYKNNHRI